MAIAPNMACCFTPDDDGAAPLSSSVEGNVRGLLFALRRALDAEGLCRLVGLELLTPELLVQCTQRATFEECRVLRRVCRRFNWVRHSATHVTSATECHRVFCPDRWCHSNPNSSTTDGTCRESESFGKKRGRTTPRARQHLFAFRGCRMLLFVKDAELPREGAGGFECTFS